MWTTSGPALAATFIDKKISHNARATIFFNMCRFSLMQVDQRTLYPRWDLHQKKFLPNLQDLSEIPFQLKPTQKTEFHLMLLWGLGRRNIITTRQMKNNIIAHYIYSLRGRIFLALFITRSHFPCSIYYSYTITDL